jgi:hypothetical protein
MLERDPYMPCDGIWRRNALPIVDHRILDPLEVHRIIDVPHVVDVCGIYRDWMAEHGEAARIYGFKLSLADKSVNNWTAAAPQL